MFSRLTSRITSAHAIALLALFISLGGTSYAVTKLPKNSVGSTQVKDGSLRATDLAKGVIPETAGAVPGPRGPRGPEGPSGATGSQGPQGPAGPASGLPSLRIANTWNDAKPMSVLPGGGQAVTPLTIPNVPAGTYRVDFTGAVYIGALPAGAADLHMESYCALWARDVDQSSAAVRLGISGAVLGPIVDYGDRAVVSDIATVERTKPFNVWVECTINHSTPSAGVIHAKLVAMPLSSVTAVPQ